MRLPAILSGLIKRRQPSAIETKALSSITENRGGWFRLFESFPGAWQTNVVVDRNLVLSYHAVYACMTLIASDISKLRVKLMRREENGIWAEFKNAAYDPVLRRPNPIQNRVQFWEGWMLSKLIRGNTYVLKGRDSRGVVNRLYVLDPTRVTPMIADDGSVFYELSADNVAGLTQDVIVPAREIIHDRMNCMFHPLVGVSPIFAAGVAATQGLRIQNNSAWFFGNRSQPGGVLTAPGAISNETAARLKENWDNSFTGENSGKVAVLGDGLKYEQMMLTAEESQLIEQLKWTSEVVCSVFHVPPYKAGVGVMPSNSNIQSLNIEYYSQCLQSLIEAAEICLDEGLEMGPDIGTEFDVDNLLRMDTVTMVTAEKEAVGAGIKSPNEARRRFDLPPVDGGDTPYLQQQNFSLAALAKRDSQPDPFNVAPTQQEAAPPPAEPEGGATKHALPKPRYRIPCDRKVFAAEETTASGDLIKALLSNTISYEQFKASWSGLQTSRAEFEMGAA
ncbi:phage portal protein [Ensifer sp. BR816]|uniref:phage portal protein n=1 Tax=Rhizobium sp. (strain BR816) TaxID=1057002 RepID=UPI00036BE377|nr:phage portal protein [Ensifer sp. BR816]